MYQTGTGLKDAPKAFSMKLGQVTRDGCGLQLVTANSELEVLQVNGQAEMLVAKDVDDLKIAGGPNKYLPPFRSTLVS